MNVIMHVQIVLVCSVDSCHLFVVKHIYNTDPPFCLDIQQELNHSYQTEAVDAFQTCSCFMWIIIITIIV